MDAGLGFQENRDAPLYARLILLLHSREVNPGYPIDMTSSGRFGDSGATRRRGVRCMLPKSRRASIVWIQTLSSTVVLKDCHLVFELMLRTCHFDISDSAGVERIHPAQFGVQETGFQTTTFEEPNHQLCFHPICSQENDLHPDSCT